MILAFKAKQDKKKDIISAIHVDDTIRVQAVSKKTNPKYWQLIEEFRKITGVPAVLNTSFNKAGEPIVCTPEDALRTFFATGLDYLILEDFLVSKKPLA
jgi:carbamoyltransferase